MKVVSDALVEFRFMRETPSKNGNGINYYYTFEDGETNFQVYSRTKYDLHKGDLCTLAFTTRLWDNRLQFDLSEVIKE